MKRLKRIAPRKKKKPLLLAKDIFHEELALPHLIPSGKFNIKFRGPSLNTPDRYFNQRLLHCSETLAADLTHLFPMNPFFIP